jgi:DNA-binding transcriptional ArsR family regulator
MEAEPGIARIATLLADPGRAKMLWALIDGRMRPAGELAFIASMSAQSASAHLAKLVDGGLLTLDAQGRHRYFRIASAEIATAIEGLASLSAARPRAPGSVLPSKSVPVQFLQARTCYDHLAGDAAVQVLDGMLKARWLAADGRNFHVTRIGDKALATLGIDLDAARRSRRVFARACVDLTQRRPHLSGALASALLDVYIRQGWILRTPRSRVVTITPTGKEAFRRKFGTR